MNILLLSAGGGGANILRSLKALFERDVATARQSDPAYAERLRRAITTRFLDTNEFSLAQAPEGERMLIGAATTGGMGSRHSPELAFQALEESRVAVERLLADYAVVVLIGTGGKGTGAGTMFPIAQMARSLRKLVLPVFVRPSFERHEVDKRRYDHALRVASEFDAAHMRLIEILNDRAYSTDDPQPQSLVWERMNLPIARGLRGLLYVLWDLSQVDPSDLSILLSGPGRMRIGFAEIAPAAAAQAQGPNTSSGLRLNFAGDPSDAEIADAVQACWENPYCAFSKPVGTSLICIQGDWSNLADAKIKGGIATLALSDPRGRPYNPLYARAFRTPKPWGVTALFTEYTGVHQPVALDWTVGESIPALAAHDTWSDELDPATPALALESAAWRLEAAGEPGERESGPHAAPRHDGATPPFETAWDFVKALVRSDRAALEIAGGAARADLPIDSATVRKLLGTFWFRTVFPLLSEDWRERMLDALGETAIQNHAFRLGRRNVRLSDLSYQQVREIAANTLVTGTAGTDLQLVLMIGQLWGETAIRRLAFAEDTDTQQDASRLGSLLGLGGSRSAGA